MIKLKGLLIKNNSINESINVGSKEYYKPTLSDKEVLELAKELTEFPHTRMKIGANLQKYFRDVANILGYPNNPTDIMTYDGSVGFPDKKKMKMDTSKAVLFKMYKDGKLSMKEYGEIQKGLFTKYIQIAKKFTNGVMHSKF